MRSSQLPEHFSLHDSGVRWIESSPEQRELRIGVDLCDYMQRGYVEGGPELVSGVFTFKPVTRVEAKPDLASFTWIEDKFDGEILEVKPLHEPEDGVEILIHTMDYRTRERDVLVLRIFGGEVTWTPDPIAGA